MVSNINIRNFPHSDFKRHSNAYRESGLFSFRHINGYLMIVLQNFKTRPAQMDQMHIDLWHKGINVLCDSGTYSYASAIGNNWH